MDPTRIRREAVEGDSALKMIREVFSDRQSCKDFLELEAEVVTLILMFNVNIHNDQSSIVREYKNIQQQISLPDDGYYRWVAQSFDKILNQYPDLDRKFYPQVVRERLTRDIFEAERRQVTLRQTSAPATLQRLTQNLRLSTTSPPVVYRSESVSDRGGCNIRGLNPDGQQPTLPPLRRHVVSFPSRAQKNFSNLTTIAISKEFLLSKQIDPTKSSNHSGQVANELAKPASGFQPSRASRGLDRTWTQESISRAVQAGGNFNPNFKSDISDFWLQNMSCPKHLNCAVRIENIASDATDQEIFSLIREGKVFSFSKSEPVAGRFPNCAARLVFTTQAAAEAFVHRGQLFPGICLRGHRWRVWWNREPCYPVKAGEQHQSRVIQIIGPESIMSAEGMERLFRSSGIKFKLVDRKEWLVEGDKMVAELSFSSILGQSRAAVKCFHDYLKWMEWESHFNIWYARDRCEPISIDMGSAFFVSGSG